jgi:hypothetical protein
VSAKSSIDLDDDPRAMVVTRVRSTTFPSAARVIREYGADKGAVQTLSRLAEYVAKLPA